MFINFLVPTLQCTETLFFCFAQKNMKKLSSKAGYFCKIEEIFTYWAQTAKNCKSILEICLFYSNLSMYYLGRNPTNLIATLSHHQSNPGLCLGRRVHFRVHFRFHCWDRRILPGFGRVHGA